MAHWLLLQLADSAFPTGGFAHSSGLEAAVQLGEVRTSAELRGFLEGALWQAGLGALPFVTAGHDAPERWEALDATNEAFLTSHVANRASRTQGRAFLAACAAVFERDEIVRMHTAAKERRVLAHLAPAFGATLRALDVPKREASEIYLHLSLRGISSAAVRLGIVGPHEAQRTQHDLAGALDAVCDACARLPVEEASQPAPLQELWGMSHDRLYARLFQS